jgi:hypothetical protein
MQVTIVGDREKNPANGLLGGQPGACASAAVEGVGPVRLKSRTVVKPGAAVAFHFAGGGGFGDVAERDAAAIERDLLLGLVTREGARAIMVRARRARRERAQDGSDRRRHRRHVHRFRAARRSAGITRTGKRLTTPDDPSRAIIEGVQRLLEETALRRRKSTASSMAPRSSPTRCWSGRARKWV